MAEQRSVRAILKDAILKALREEIDFEVEDGDTVRSLAPEAIVFRRNAIMDRKHEQDKQNELLPGVLLSAPLTETINPKDGETAHDVWPYLWLIQIVDAENFEREGNEETYWRWIEQVAGFFMFSEYLMEVDLGVDICMKSVTIVSTDNVDEKTWNKSSLLKAAIALRVEVLRGRG